MTGTVVSRIEAIDALVQKISSLSHISPDAGRCLWTLHLALNNLRIEAGDSDSLLYSSLYVDRLRALIESCGRTLENAESSEFKKRVKAQGERINDFLDQIQLRPDVDQVDEFGTEGNRQLEGIKDTVDNVAKRVFSRRDSGFVEGDDDLWKEFKSELEHEGFSKDVLRKHKDVLRAYIRGLESMSPHTGGPPPTFRRLLEQETTSSTNKHLRPRISREEKEVVSVNDRVVDPGFRPNRPPATPAKEFLAELPEASPRLIPTDEASSRQEKNDDALALIRTQDLMKMESLSTGLTNTHLESYSVSPRTFPPPQMPSPSSFLGASPQAHRTAPPRPLGYQLGPDSQGRQIPPDAIWTRVNRNFVSPEVLEIAHVRYEARPTYVAILGRLDRSQIEEYARQSFEVRARRYHGGGRGGESARGREDTESETDLASSSDESDTSDYGGAGFDVKGKERAREGDPCYIVSPPEKTSPSSTTKPKSILKNKNAECHVRFDPTPQELGPKTPPSSSFPRSYSSKPRSYGATDTGRRSSRYLDSEYDEDEIDTYEQEEEDRRKRRDGRSRRKSSSSSSSKRSRRRSTWGKLGAAGAAVSLLTVLAEAATGGI